MSCTLPTFGGTVGAVCGFGLGIIIALAYDVILVVLFDGRAVGLQNW